MSKRAMVHLSSDEAMSALVARIGAIRLKALRLSPFQSLTRAIVYQQLSGKAAGTIFGRFVAMYPDGFPSSAQVVNTSIEKLRSAGLSRGKASYILDLAQHSEARLLPSLEDCDVLSDSEIITKFMEVKGIGRWTAEMFLIFNLGRPDVLPVHDLGVRRGFQITYGKRKLPEPERLEDHGLRWGPHRTMAARYLWRAADSEGI